MQEENFNFSCSDDPPKTRELSGEEFESFAFALIGVMWRYYHLSITMTDKYFSAHTDRNTRWNKTITVAGNNYELIMRATHPLGMSTVWYLKEKNPQSECLLWNPTTQKYEQERA